MLTDLLQDVTRRVLCLPLILSLVPAATRADNEPLPNLLETEHELSLAFETPHTRWGKPYAGGTTRVLFFTPWLQGSTAGRETIELMQRFDLDADAVYFLPQPARLLGDGNPRSYLDLQAGTKRVLRLLKTQHDVYFFNQVAPASLPEEVRERLEENVAAGAGIVIVSGDGKLPFPSARAAPATPAAGAGVPTFRLGQGRGVLLPLREKLDSRLGWQEKFDRQMARQGRALLWAADRAPRGNLRLELLPSVARDDLPRDAVSLLWDDGLVGAEVRLELRRPDGTRRLVGATELVGRRRASFRLPVTPAGPYYVTAVATRGEAVENWAFEPLDVTSPRRIDAVVLEKDWGEIGDTVRGTVQFHGAVEASDTVEIRVLDPGGRILQTMPLANEQHPGAVPFAFAVRDWMPMLVRVEAVLSDQRGELSSAHAFCRVTKRHRNQFNFVVWNWPTDDLMSYGLQSFRANGVTAVLQGGEPPLSLAANDLSLVPYSTSYRKSSHTVSAMLGPDGVMKGGCTHDPAVLAEQVRSVVERHHRAREHGVFVYSLGDENAVRGSCLSEHCLRAYQRYLQEIYGSVDALNREWNSDYASFDAITLLTGPIPADDAPRWFREYFEQRVRKDRTDSEGDGEAQITLGITNDELRALQMENYARWYDRQAFQCFTYVQWCKAFVKGFREIDSKSLTGFEGTDSFTIRRLTTRSRQGGDLDAFVREVEYFGPYGGPANEVMRSIAPPTMPTGNWIGYSMDGEVLLRKYWGQITNGMNAVQWWRWDNLDGYHGFLAPTFLPHVGTRQMLEDTRIVREGLGDLLMRCTMEDDGVAMLYSMPSTHIAHFDGNRTYGLYKRDHELWHAALHDSGLQFRYVTDRMLRRGEFDARRYRVLILPLAFAIGPEEADVIREYVREGGTLLADVRPGVYDGHTKPLESGALDDVFGIERSGRQDAVELDRLVVDGEIAGQRLRPLHWGNWRGHEIYPQMKVDPTVEVTTGKALGQAFPIHFWYTLNHPVGIVNEFGKGRAVLLNFPLYPTPPQPLIQDILSAAGVAAQIKIRTPDGSPVAGLEVTRWRNEGIELVALLGDHTGTVHVTLPEKRVVHNLKADETLGALKEFAVDVRPHRAVFLALLPAPPSAPTLRMPPSVVAGTVVRVEVSIPGAAGRHAVHVTVSGPDSTGWKKNLIVDSNPQSFEFVVAANDPPGVWTVRARDLFLEKEVRALLQVEAAPVAE